MITAEAATIELLQEENALLKKQIEWFKRQLFGQKSEKTVSFQNENQMEFEGLDTPTPAKKPKKKVEAHEREAASSQKGQDKIALPTDLPKEIAFIDIPESQKTCPVTGKQLVKIGEEITTKLAYKPGSYFIKEIIRPKYALPQGGEEGILTAPLPESLLNRCMADDSFLADILVKKYNDHLPLYRISEILRRNEIQIPRQILSQWVVRAGHALEPLYDEMTKQITLSGNVFIDESPVKMLDPGRGKTHTAFMWVLCGGKTADPPYRVYNFRKNRQHHHATRLLENFQGVLHSDKYGAYEELANAKKFIWCPCWAHIRRKFIEAESGDNDFRDWVLEKINQLFMLEREVWGLSEEERIAKRKRESVPIIDELIAAIKDKMVTGKILPKSKFKEALGYFSSLIPYLKNYTLHTWARMDNNVAERAIRPLAVGRKNWLFVGNEKGGKASAIILSLIQTCRGLSIDPREYLEDVMKRLMSHSANKLNELLPDQWAMSRQSLNT